MAETTTADEMALDTLVLLDGMAVVVVTTMGTVVVMVVDATGVVVIGVVDVVGRGAGVEAATGVVIVRVTPALRQRVFANCKAAVERC